MTFVLQAPERRRLSGTSVFLAGGIPGCCDWQSDLIADLWGLDATLINPRRADWSASPGELRRQVHWESDHLRDASLIAFWFPSETLCPITLFELGKAIGTNALFVLGAHQHYGRLPDLHHQLEAAGRTKPIARSVTELAEFIRLAVSSIQSGTKP